MHGKPYFIVITIIITTALGSQFTEFSVDDGLVPQARPGATMSCHKRGRTISAGPNPNIISREKRKTKSKFE